MTSEPGEGLRKDRFAALEAASLPVRAKPSNYPEPFASRMTGRRKQALGDAFGLKNFGVNRVVLEPGAVSALRHAHTVQDEFLYVLEGQPTLVTNEGEQRLRPGLCAGFRGGEGNAQHLRNDTEDEVVFLIVGDRLPGDAGSYPDDDLAATLAEGRWVFQHKDGRPYGDEASA